MKRKVKIFVFTRSLDKGVGISKWIVDYYSTLAQYKEFEITLMLESGETNYDNLTELPFSIERMPHIKKHPIKAIKSWIVLSHRSDIDWYHFHTDSFINFFPFLFLRRVHQKVIIQSHNSSKKAVVRNLFKRFLHNIGKVVVKRADFVQFSVSEPAAKWLFDERDYVQINNGIDLKRYIFSQDLRDRLRAEYGFQDSVVFGHIGRFDDQKNHSKLIEIFTCILKQQPNAKLFLIGDGPLRSTLEAKVQVLGIQNAVIFAGMRSNVDELLNMMDYFVFPSLYEGLPLAMIEAQANGLDTFYSNRITKEVQLLPSTTPFDISADGERISKIILDSPKNSNEMRLHSNRIVKEKGYDKLDTVVFLRKFYLELV